MSAPFPQLAPPQPDPKVRGKTRALPPPSLPWGEALIVISIGLILLQI